MLWKNFGVTRHGKVVFYDYDEIEYLTDCNFRRVPEARNEEEEMSGEVWYPVGPNDVFPETFGPFLLGNPSGARGVHEAPRRPARRGVLARRTRSASWPATCTTSSPTTPASASHPASSAADEPTAGTASGAACARFPHPLEKELTMTDPIVIVSAARTPIGGLLGDFSSLAAHASSARSRSRPRSSAPASPGDAVERSADRQLPDGRPGPGAGAPGDAQAPACRSRPAPSRCRRCAARACAR